MELTRNEESVFLAIGDTCGVSKLFISYIDTELEVAEAELSELKSKEEYLKTKIAELSMMKVNVASVVRQVEINANATLRGVLERLEVTDDPAHYVAEISKEGKVSLVKSKDQ